MALRSGVSGSPVISSHRHVRHLGLGVAPRGDRRARSRHDGRRASQRGRRHSLRLTGYRIARITRRFRGRCLLFDDVNRRRRTIAVASDAVRGDRISGRWRIV